MRISTDQFVAMADLFVHGAHSPQGTDVALTAELARPNLDYSLESLRSVDRYLTTLFKQHALVKRLPGLDRTIVFGGAYVGEVIRRAVLPAVYHWEDSRSYLLRHPELVKVFGPGAYDDVCVRSMLVGAGDRMTMPVNKVRRFLAEGLENSVHYYASVEAKAVAEVRRGAHGTTALALSYREFATGVRDGNAYRVGEIDFHGFDRSTGELVETKDGYAFAIDPKTGEWTAQFRAGPGSGPGQESLADELALAQRQIEAARGTPIVWRCAETQVAELFDRAFAAGGLSGIRAVYYPWVGQG